MKLCLDVGNVLCNVDFTGLISALKARGFDEEDVWFFLNRIQPLQDLGHTNMKTEIRSYFGIKDGESIVKAWYDAITPYETSLRYMEEFLDAGVEVAILSNIGHEHYSNLPNVLGPNISKCIHHMSCEVGARKPSLLYYQSFLQRHPDFEYATYVDDRRDNLATGSALKFRSIHMDTAIMSKDEVTAVWESIKNYLFQPDWHCKRPVI